MAASLPALARGGDDPVVSSQEPNSSRTAPPVIDDLSKQIIAQLQEDGRRAYATIGKAVGLSEAAVRQRVQRLSDSGVIQIVAVSDPLQVGLFRQAMVAINVDGPLEPVADALAEMNEIDYVVLCAGRFDVLCEAVCADDEALLDLTSNRIRALPGVRNAEVLVYLKLRKQSYQWGVR
jgi:Lrp/AsnC family transcriptional regulator, regulator for asnA, asnC and gidA